MKMAKRVGMWLMVFVMVCSLLGCSKEKELTAEEVYALAYEKINSMPGMDAKMDMDMSMTAEGETMEVGLEADLLMENLNSEDMKMDMKMTMNMLGIGIDVQAYYVDGYYLMDMMGQKIKYPMPMDEAMGQAAMMQEVAVEALSEITMTEEEGLRVLTYSVDMVKLTEGFMDDYLNSMGMAEMQDGLEYKSMQGVMKVNEEGYPVEITMELEMTMEMEGVQVDCTADMVAVYNNPGQPVTVEIPDASAYIEVDPETMS